MEMKDILAQHVAAFEKKLDGNDLAIKELRAITTDIEQKMARRPGPHLPERAPSMGQLFVEHDEVKSMIGSAQAGRRYSVEMKAIISSATSDADGSAGDLLIPTRDQAIVPIAKRQLMVRDLLTVVPVTGNSVEFVKQTGFTNNAATVAEGATKPQSEMKFDLVTTNVRTIAHWMLASRQILDDAPQIKGFIDQELSYGLAYVEDNQLLNGAGTGTDLNGVYTQATAFSGSITFATPNLIDVIGVALLQNSLANLPADGIVLHPADWMRIRLLKNTDGEYLLGEPGAVVEPRLFGLPVVATAAMTQDKFLVGAFKSSATLYDRWVARVEASLEDSDNFRKNLVTLLAEERIALAVKNTAAFTKGDFSDAITAITAS